MKIQLKPKQLYVLLSLLMLIFCSACSIYKTIYVEPISQESINAVHSVKRNVVINNVYTEGNNEVENELVLKNFKVTTENISGTLVFPPEGKRHSFNNKSFAKKRIGAFDPLNTMHIYTSETSIDTGYFELPISRINSIELHENDYWASAAGSIGLIVVAGGVAVLGGVAIACSCPQVSSLTSAESQYHGSLFPGSIFKSLKRTDHLILEDVISEKGDLHLRIANELPEMEYIDQMSILQIDHQGYKNLAINEEGDFVAFNNCNTAYDITSHRQNIKEILSQEDDLNFDFDNPEIKDELNSIVLKFDKSKFSKNPYLYIRGKQAKWLETVADYSFYNIGKSYNNWVERKDKANPDKWKKRNIKQGISLNIYLKLDGKWKYLGSHHDAGTMAMRNLMMAINLDEHNNDLVEIKLECAYKLWEIDFVGLTDEWKDDLMMQELIINSAADNEGNDVTTYILNTDNNYHVLNNSGTYIDIWSKGIVLMEQSTLVLQGTGYYHNIKEYDHKANLKFAMKVNSKRGVQDVSRELYHYQTLMTFAGNN